MTLVSTGVILAILAIIALLVLASTVDDLKNSY